MIGPGLYGASVKLASADQRSAVERVIGREGRLVSGGSHLIFDAVGSETPRSLVEVLRAAGFDAEPMVVFT